jgi:hypothetical protein
MKIIDIGICIDNNDPKGLGRIRVVRFADYVSEKEKASNYEPYTDNDIFVSIPFLPLNINFIPEVDQAVKIINYNAEKENVNSEYIAGPFTTLHNFNDQSFSPQLTNTTYGVSIKHKPDMFDNKGNYRKKFSIGSFANQTDYGVYGKYGSDLIFTEDGLQLRGGKLLSKGRAKPKDRQDIYSFPIMSSKSSVLTLKKFPYKMEVKTTEIKQESVEVKDLKYLVEYDIVDESNQTTLSDFYAVNFYVYKITKPFGDLLKTNRINENTEIPSNLLKLINLENDTTSVTHKIILPTSDDFWDPLYIKNEIKDFIYTIHEKDLKEINPLYGREDLHPFFFRPKQSLLSKTGTTEEVNLKKSIFSSISMYGIGPQSGLIFSLGSVKPKVKPKKIKKEKSVLNKKSDEQSFSSLKSDKIYFLSTDTNNTEKIVPFEKLNKYEYNQNDYIERIDPNTYAVVRGENLIRLLEKMIAVLFEHEHNVVGPFVKTDQFQSYVDLIKLIETMKNDLLNGSIRIN